MERHKIDAEFGLYTEAMSTTNARTGDPVEAPDTGFASIAIFLIGLFAGLAMVLVGFRSQSFVHDRFDPYQFGEMGASIARGNGFTGWGTLLSRRAPLYPIVIGGVYFAFGEHPFLVQLLQSAMLGGTCWLVFDMGRRVFNRRTGLLAGIACAFHPMMLRYVADLQLETQLTFVFTLTVWCTVRVYRTPTVANGALVGIAGGFAALTKAVVVLYPALFSCLWLAMDVVWLRYREKAVSKLPAVAAILTGMMVVIAPWTLRNYRASGHFVLISTGLSDAFLRGYIFSKTDYALLRKPPYTDAENETNAWFEQLGREAGTEWAKDDYETEQLLSRAAKEKLRSDPGAFLRKFGVGLFTFWYEMTSFANSLLAGIFALGAWILAFIGARRGWRERRPAWLFLLPAIQLNLLLAALLALGRYSAPVVPSLIVLSAFGLDWLLVRGSESHV